MVTGIYIMLVFFQPIGAAGVEKIGIYQTREECVKAAEDAGFLPISKDKHPALHAYACVFSTDPYIME